MGLPDPTRWFYVNADRRSRAQSVGAQLLSAEDEGEAMRLAWLLDDCNEKRKSIQKDMTREAMEKAKAYLIEKPDAKALIIDGQNWHSGLSGLVAGAIKDKFSRPACVVTYVENEDGETEGRASGRSIDGVHVADIFLAAQSEGLLVTSRIQQKSLPPCALSIRVINRSLA